MGRNLFFEKHFLPESKFFKPFLTFSSKIGLSENSGDYEKHKLC